MLKKKSKTALKKINPRNNSRLKVQVESAFDGIIMENTRESIYAINRKFKYITFNKNHFRIVKLIYGVTISVGESSVDFLKNTPEYKWLRKDFARALKGELFVSEQYLNQVQYKDRYIETTYNPIFGKKKNITGVAVFVRDITERKKSEEKLKSTLEELSERNFELDQIMYKTSHDLRSPLSSILGLVNLAYLDANSNNHLNYFNKIEGRIKKLDEFIKTMLNYAYVNRSDVTYENIDLKETINSCVQELQYLENFSAVKVSVSIVNGVSLKSDALRIKIIFANIISNAYKYYNPAGNSYLKIKAHITHQRAEVDFRDNGIGIKKEYLARVFDMFYRATEKSQGSGLGMYIVKQAVDKLKGTIKAKSIFGKGTSIKIILPNH